MSVRYCVRESQVPAHQGRPVVDAWFSDLSDQFGDQSLQHFRGHTISHVRINEAKKNQVREQDAPMRGQSA